MPQQSHPLAGHIYDNNQVPLAGVIVYLKNTTAGRASRSDEADDKTTNSNGEFILNANLVTYEDGDTYEIIATLDGYVIGKVTGTIDIVSGPEQNADIYMSVNLSKFNSGSVRDLLQMGNYGGVLSKFNQTFQVWANDKAATAAAAVIVSGGAGRGKGFPVGTNPIINLVAGQVAYITKIVLTLRTDAKNVYVEPVKCSGADGAGNAVALSGQLYADRGTATQNRPVEIEFSKPIRVEYNSDSAKSIGVQSAGTDTATKFDFILMGYVLEDIR